MPVALPVLNRIEDVGPKLGGVSPKLVRTLIRSGRLEAHRVGRLLFVSDEAIARYLQESKEPARETGSNATPTAKSNWRQRWAQGA